MSAIPSLPATLSPALSGREAIADAVYRFVLGLDTNDPALFDSAFLPESTFEINGRLLEGLPAIHAGCLDPVVKLDTTHLVTNVRVNIADSGVEAALTASALAQHFPGGKGNEANYQKRLLAGALYYADLVRNDADGLWKIKAFRMTTTWVEGDWGVIHGA